MMKYFIQLFLLCLYCTETKTQSWEQVYPDYPVHDYSSIVHWNGDTVYIAGNNSGFFRSIDAGQTWKSVLHSNTWFDFVRMAKNSKAVYLMPGSSFFTYSQFLDSSSMFLFRYNPVTNDTLRIIVPIPNPTHVRRKSIEDISITESGIYVLQARDKLTLLFSNNDGFDWLVKELPDSLTLSGIIPAIYFNNKGDGIFTNGVEVYQTNDNGSTWTQIKEFTTKAEPQHSFFKYPGQWVNDSTFIMIDATNGLQRSTDRGKSWHAIEKIPCGVESFVFSENGEGYVISRYAGICRTTDTGATWINVHPESNLSGFCLKGLILGENRSIFAGYYGTILITTDKGVTWDESKVPEMVVSALLNFYSENDGVAQAEEIDTYKQWFVATSDGGSHWKKIVQTREIGYGQMIPVSESVIWTIRNATHGNDTLIYHSSDGGFTWDPSLRVNEGDSISFAYYSASSRLNKGDDSLCLVLNGGSLLITINSGNTWNRSSNYFSLFNAEDKADRITLYMNHDRYQWMRTKTKILRSTDFGMTWTIVFDLPVQDAGSSFADINAMTADHILVEAFIYETNTRKTYFYESYDAGVSWDRHELTFQSPLTQQGWSFGFGIGDMFPNGWGLSIGQVTLSQYQSEIAFLLTKDAWRTASVQTVIHQSPGASSSFDYFWLTNNIGWFSTISQVLKTTNGGLNWVRLPDELWVDNSISESYPNPVSPGSALSLDLELAGVQEQRISLTLYDTMGRKITTLREDAVAPGRTSVSFPTTGLSPGLYFVRLVTERGMDVRKVVVR